MDTKIKITELISTDIRLRANVNIIRSAIDGIKGNIKLDFNGVTFISRSFADELYSLTKEHENILVEGMSDIVKSMFDVVKEGRESKRIFKESKSEIKEFDDIESLSEYLVTM